MEIDFDVVDEVADILRPYVRRAGGKGVRFELDWLADACGSADVAEEVFCALGMRCDGITYSTGNGNSTLANHCYPPCAFDKIAAVVS